MRRETERTSEWTNALHFAPFSEADFERQKTVKKFHSKFRSMQQQQQFFYNAIFSAFKALAGNPKLNSRQIAFGLDVVRRGGWERERVLACRCEKESEGACLVAREGEAFAWVRCLVRASFERENRFCWRHNFWKHFFASVWTWSHFRRLDSSILFPRLSLKFSLSPKSVANLIIFCRKIARNWTFARVFVGPALFRESWSSAAAPHNCVYCQKHVLR